MPALGAYDDRDPVEVGRRVRLARDHGVDAFVYGTFWCRGKRVFEDALDLGFLGSAEASTATFGVMWANRMPRRVLPVRRADLPVIDDGRRVPSDVDDFVAFVAHVATRYFARPTYLRVDGRAYLSIFDSTFFVRELGLEAATEAVRARARAWLASRGLPDLYLVAIDPAPDVIGRMASVGFDAVSHYVLLPDWTGPVAPGLRGVRAAARGRVGRATPPPRACRTCPPSRPGWDASPRGADFGPRRPDKYPWSPVVVGEHPDRFRAAVARAVAWARARGPRRPAGDGRVAQRVERGALPRARHAVRHRLARGAARRPRGRRGPFRAPARDAAGRAWRGSRPDAAHGPGGAAGPAASRRAARTARTPTTTSVIPTSGATNSNATHEKPWSASCRVAANTR